MSDPIELASTEKCVRGKKCVYQNTVDKKGEVCADCQAQHEAR